MQISSAIASALQVQEAVKLLCGLPTAAGKKIVFNGVRNDFDVIGLTINPACDVHASYEIRSTPLTSAVSIREFLEYAQRFVGGGVELDLSAEQFTFVENAACRSCGSEIVLNRTAFRIFDWESICESCRTHGSRPSTPDDVSTLKRTLSRIGLDSPKHLLDRSLGELGVPAAHVLAVTGEGGSTALELTGDVVPILRTIGVHPGAESAGQVRDQNMQGAGINGGY